MTRWVALLRAVNVGGTSKLPMETLQQALAAIGFENMRTYIASGNIVFDAPRPAGDIVHAIDALLNASFGIQGERTILRTADDILRLPRLNPFIEAAKQRPNMLHVHFPAGPLHERSEYNLTSFKGPERLRLKEGHVFIDYINGAGQSALTPRFLESSLGVAGTSRNWNTVLALINLVETG